MSTAAATPDLTVYYLIHRAMRNDAARLAQAVARLRPEDHRGARALHEWYGGFVTELHHHHVVEDTIFFPALVERVPSASRDLDRIAVDHERLNELLERGRAAVRELAGGSDDRRVTHTAAVEVTAELADLLEAHLAFEDDELLPLFATQFTAQEYDGFHAQAAKDLDVRAALFTIPWVVSWATDTEREVAFASTPRLFRLVWSLRRRRFARLDEAALGPRSVPVEVS
jgi:hypothetical protein